MPSSCGRGIHLLRHAAVVLPVASRTRSHIKHVSRWQRTLPFSPVCSATYQRGAAEISPQPRKPGGVINDDPPPPPAGRTRQCSHDTAAENLVVKLVKAPECEWGSSPTPTKVTEVASAIDKIIGGGVAPAARRDEKVESASAPGYEGTVPVTSSPKDMENTIAFELD